MDEMHVGMDVDNAYVYTVGKMQQRLYMAEKGKNK